MPQSVVTSSSDDTITRILSKLQQKLGNVKIIDFTFDDKIVAPGTNGCTDVARLHINYENDGKFYEKCFFLKIPYSAATYKTFQPLGFYAKELYMYETVLPKFQYLLGDENLAPRYFCSDDREALALEDISRDGYQMLDRRRQLDFEECAKCFRVLAKFHAASIKVRETEAYHMDVVGVEPFMRSGFAMLEDGLFAGDFQEQFLKLIARVDSEFAEKNADNLEKYKNRLFLSAVDEIKPIENTLNVLNHGDLWCNNIMFKYDKFRCVSDAILIDFQLCRWTSPVIDIIYFTINSMKFDVFERYFELLLNIYVNTFNAVLRYLECELKSISVRQLTQVMETKYEYWVYLLFFSTVVQLRETKPADTKETMMDCSGYKEELFMNVSKKWILYFIQKGVFTRNNDQIYAIRTYLRKFHHDNDVEIVKYEIDDNIVADDQNNHSTKISRLRFDYIDKNGSSHRRSLILKIPSLSATYKFCRLSKETFFLEKLFPKLRSLWSEDEYFTSVCYGTVDSEILFLENLNENGYLIRNQKVRLDFEHSRVALKTLARFHAVSFEYLQRAGEVELQEISQFVTDPTVIQFSIDSFARTIKMIAPFLSESIVEKLAKYENLNEKTLLTFQPNEYGRKVLVHGEYGISNTLFKYDQHDRVCYSKIINWKLCCIGSPVIDLITFILSSVRQDVYGNRADHLFDLYLTEFNRTLDQLGCEKLYKRVELDGDLKSHKFHWLNTLLSVLPPILENTSSKETCNNSEQSSLTLTQFLVKWLNYMNAHDIL